ISLRHGHPAAPARSVMKENPIKSLPGIPFVFVVLILAIAGIWMIATGLGPDPDNGLNSGWRALCGLLVVILAFLSLIGLYKVEHNLSAVLSLFVNNIGTVKEPGLHWNYTFFGKLKVSLRVCNFESGKLKDNEL